MFSIIRPTSGRRTTCVAGALAWVVLLGVAALAAELRGPGPKDRCPVCGMFVEKYENWVATVLLADGRQVFFDGPKDLFRFLHDPPKYGHDGAAIGDVLVTDYYTTRTVRAREAFFVAGSDVMGPMGHELVAFRSESDAQTFVRDHGGGRILRFAEVTKNEVPE